MGSLVGISFLEGGGGSQAINKFIKDIEDMCLKAAAYQMCMIIWKSICPVLGTMFMKIHKILYFNFLFLKISNFKMSNLHLIIH